MSLKYYWSTPIYTDTILDNKLLDKTTNYILSNYGDGIKVNANLLDENILENKNLLEFKDNVITPAFEEFYKKEFNVNLNEKKYHLKAWIAGKTFSYSMPSHNHSGSQLSAVFYLLCEENDKGGELVLQDPRFNANRGYKDEYNKWFNNEIVIPQTGQFIIFPSFLYHNVKTFFGKIRLAMPVDLILY